MIVSATNGSTFVEAGGDRYEVMVNPGESFSLVALEVSPDPTPLDRVEEQTLFGWAVVEQPGLVAPTTVDLDFAMGVVPHAVSGSVGAPLHPRLAEEGRLYLEVRSGGALSGYASATSPTPDDTAYDFDLQYVDVPNIYGETYYVLSTPGGDYCYVVRGVPTDGPQGWTMPTPPVRTSPVGTGPFPWTTPVTFTLENVSGSELLMSVRTDEAQVGMAQLAWDDASFALPPLPSTSTELPAGPLYASIGACGGWDHDIDCESWAEEAGFEVESPF